MSSTFVLILCSLLLQGEGNVPPRQPVVQQEPFAPAATPPVGSQPVVPSIVSPTRANQLYIRNGALTLPIDKRNQVTLSAPVQAILTSLNTEKRDAAGNMRLDESDNPIPIPVTLGMNVFKGQVLGTCDDRELRSTLKINQAQLEVAKAEREKIVEIEHAARGVQIAMAELQQMLEANKQVARTFTDTEIRRAVFAQHQAEAQLELTKYNIEVVKVAEVVVRESELEQTQDKIERRQLTAHIDGMVVEIKAAEGEWLREGDPVLEIMQLDTLWVQALVPVKDYEISDVDGKSAVVQVVFANGKTETFQGTVVFCNPVIEAGDAFKAYIEIQNRRVGNYWLLQPGRRGIDITIAL